jgi:hypothetical protein
MARDLIAYGTRQLIAYGMRRLMFHITPLAAPTHPEEPSSFAA